MSYPSRGFSQASACVPRSWPAVIAKIQPCGLSVGCLLILVRGMCNMLDGMVAVSQGVASAGGEMFNEIPDRLSDALTLVGAGYAIGGTPELGYIAAIAAVFTAYVRVQGCCTWNQG